MILVLATHVPSHRPDDSSRSMLEVELPELEAPQWGIIVAALVVLFVLIVIVKRVVRRFARRERETTERALWAMSGYYMTTRIFRRWGYGHKKGRRRR